MDAKDAAKVLGKSTRYLRDRRRAGDFERGHHYRVTNPNAARLSYQYHVPRVERLWNSDPALLPVDGADPAAM